VLLSLEICLLSILLNFSISVLILNDLGGVIIAVLITVIAAAESALGLSIIIFFYKMRGSISSKNLSLLKN
jgi:NADH:ubiquinone oxidoreductase subunit K